MRYRQSMDNALDVLIFLAYAAMLGLCVGALLGALALMLASPAHASDGAANLLLRRAPDAAAWAAPLISADTVFRSDGPIQRVRVVQAFRNPFHEGMEGVYVMRLPANATLERLTLTVRGVAESDADDTEETDSTEPARSYAVVPTEEPGLVTRLISGIEPGETVLVEVEYQQVARYERGRAVVRLLTQTSTQLTGLGRRRRSRPRRQRETVPLGVESAWLSANSQTGAPWLWLVPVVALYALVAFLS